jgi:hypothetical protein
VKDLDISGKPWVDSLHLASEIPDFYTRYLATVESDLGILVTFSVRKDKYDEYAPDIENMVKSMRAFRKPGDVNMGAGGGSMDGVDPNATIFNSTEGTVKKKAPTGGGGDAGMMILLLLVVVGGGAFFIWKKKQQK